MCIRDRALPAVQRAARGAVRHDGGGVLCGIHRLHGPGFHGAADRPDAVYFDPAAHCVDRLYDADEPFYGAFCRAPHAAFAAKQVLPESPQKAA